MENAGESPLDVLSTVASIVQENETPLSPSPTPSPTSDDSPRQPTTAAATTTSSSVQQPKQTTKWKRDRRSRLPEYSRKSDAKYPSENGSSGPPTPEPVSNGGVSNGLGAANGTGGVANGDTPLDMSVRHRGLPPSYAQTVNSPGYRSRAKPTAVVHDYGTGVRDELPQGISMCDPIIEEHFRRSLGSAYHTVFQSNLKDVPPPKSPPKPPPVAPTNVIELMDSEGLSVDDHFAKALGDTWKKLNRKETGRESKSESLVSI